MRGVLLPLKREKLLLFADTHVGYEVELRREKGVNVVSQTDKLIEKILELINLYNATSVVILGDVKHELPVPRESFEEVKRFLTIIAKEVPLLLIPGNHDSMLNKIVEKVQGVELAPARGVVYKRFLLFHGHIKPLKEDLERVDTIIMGHTHPAVVIRDEIGYATKEPAILKIYLNRSSICKTLYEEECGKKDNVKIIVLPASHPLITGVDVREIPQLAAEGRTFLKYVEWTPERVEIYLSDLTYIGTLSEVQISL
ncbi:MAG: metallophosphoesterase [Pyrobaculum sp.]